MIPILGRIVKKIAPRIGARVTFEPKWKIAGQIIFKNGKKRYFRYSSIDLNPLAASDIAKDKDFCAYFLRKMGYPTIIGKTFFSELWCRMINSSDNTMAACKYAARTGFPVIVKPNSGSQGSGVAKVYSQNELKKALRFIFAFDRVAIIQPVIVGNDYRVVVLDDKVISAYQRLPLSVVGDGISSIRRLLQLKQKVFAASSRDTRLNSKDPRIIQKLRHAKLSLSSILKKDTKFFLLDNANLSTGGDAVDVTADIHPAFKHLAVKITKDMGLRLCGVDLMVKGDIRKPPKNYHIIEINAAPGLDHYALSGHKQAKIVEEMYTKVLLAMAK